MKLITVYIRTIRCINPLERFHCSNPICSIHQIHCHLRLCLFSGIGGPDHQLTIFFINNVIRRILLHIKLHGYHILIRTIRAGIMGKRIGSLLHVITGTLTVKIIKNTIRILQSVSPVRLLQAAGRRICSRLIRSIMYITFCICSGQIVRRFFLLFLIRRCISLTIICFLCSLCRRRFLRCYRTVCMLISV